MMLKMCAVRQAINLRERPEAEKEPFASRRSDLRRDFTLTKQPVNR